MDEYRYLEGVERTTFANRYVTPYLTCKECNTCSFVNDEPLRRRILHMENPGFGSLFQDLPPCPRCGASHAYALGIFDFSDHIRDSVEALRESRRLRARAATVLQTFLRMFYYKQKYLLKKRQIAFREARDCRMATRLQRVYRGRLGRIRFLVNKRLARIRNADSLVMYRALNDEFPGSKKVFWYTRRAELEVLFNDYSTLVRRTGSRPPKHKVEQNIIEISRRVHLLECEYAACIQSRMRGMMGRVFARNYRQAQARQLENFLTSALKIQRCARGWYGRVRARKIRGHHRANVIAKEYVVHRKKKSDKFRDAEWKQRVLLAYRKERAEESMARMIGKTVYGALDGRRIEAFKRSGYCSEERGRVMGEFFQRQKSTMEAQVEREYAKNARRTFLLNTIDRNEAFSKYFKSELPVAEASGMRWMIDLSKSRKKLAASPKNPKLTKSGSKALTSHFERRYEKYRAS